MLRCGAICDKIVKMPTETYKQSLLQIACIHHIREEKHIFRTKTLFIYLTADLLSLFVGTTHVRSKMYYKLRRKCCFMFIGTIIPFG